MASSSSQNKPETINLNDTPSVMPEVWRPYFLSINGPVSVTDSVMLNGDDCHRSSCRSLYSRRMQRNLEVKALRSQVTILQRLLKESKKKSRGGQGGEQKAEGARGFLCR
uniref:Uncharacterized protein n=1 Tax=Fagus sylvatica TaxID=28930 RepID=A0A2N9HSV8_FAGSY